MKYELEEDYELVSTIHKLFENDKYLLFFLVFLEAYKEDRDHIRLSEIAKNIDWRYEDFYDDLPDEEYYTAQDRAFGQAEFFYEYSYLGFFTDVGIEDYEETISKMFLYFAKELKEEEINKDTADYFRTVMRDLLYFADERTKMIEEKYLGNSESELVNINSEIFRKEIRRKDLFFSKEERYFGKLHELMGIIPGDIIILIQKDEKGFKKLENELKEYLGEFILNNHYLDEKNNEIRESIPTQIDLFIRYINNLNPINGYVDIPFSVLKESKFEAIKLIKHLELQGNVKVRWSDEKSLKLKFSSSIIDENIFSQDEDQSEKFRNKLEIYPESEKLKFNLSFVYAVGVLTISANNGFKLKLKTSGSVQKEVLRIMFQNPKNTYSEWSLYDISEAVGAQDVNVKSVNNAIYNLNKKVRIAIPQIEKLFELTQDSTKINAEYVEKT
jgi:hypothetical protein